MAELTATVVADSITEQGDRLTSMVLSLPHSLLTRLGSYRALSRTTAPGQDSDIISLVSGVLLDGFVPGTSLSDQSRESWLHARDNAVIAVLNGTIGLDGLSALLRKNVESNRKSWGKTALNAELISKELTAYVEQSGLEFSSEALLLEPFMWTTVLVSATDWDNLTALARHTEPKEGDTTLNGLAAVVRDALDQSSPNLISEGQWHLPFLNDEELTEAREGSKEAQEKLILVSVARSGGISVQSDAPSSESEVEYANLLLRRGHVSAWEHAATPAEQSWGAESIVDGLPSWRGGSSLVSNFTGWTQARKMVEGESVLDSVENMAFTL